MDCAAEERLVRLTLQADSSVHRIDADLSARTLDVYHDGPANSIHRRLQPLNLGAAVVTSAPFTGQLPSLPQTASHEARTLRLVLGINAVMFLAESIGGYVADSSALLADSLDMFADAAVYALALYGAGQAVEGQRRAARLSGWLQLTLAGGALFEVARRAVGGSAPESGLMMGVAAVALLANGTCMWLLARHRMGGPHMRASWIFTTNDVLANLGVIAGGILVRLSGSAVPDLLVGASIGLVVLNGAVRILRLSAESGP